MIDGSMAITANDRALKGSEITYRKKTRGESQNMYIPPEDHPWKKYL